MLCPGAQATLESHASSQQNAALWGTIRSTKDKRAERFSSILGRWSAEVLQDIDGLLQKSPGQEKMHIYVLNFMNQKWKKQNKQKNLKPWRKGNWYLAAGDIVHKLASKSLTAQREQVIAGKNYLVGPSTYYTNKKESANHWRWITSAVW